LHPLSRSDRVTRGLPERPATAVIERGAKESSSTTMTDSIAVSLPDHFKMTPGTHLLPWVMNVEGEDQSVEGPVRRAGWDHVARRPVVRESTPESANLPEGPAGLGALDQDPIPVTQFAQTGRPEQLTDRSLGS
jgi:hypothetical protein